MEDDEEEEELEQEIFPDTRLGKLQQKLWDIFDKPTSSKAAQVVGIVSMFCIFVSTAIVTLDTLPYFQVHVWAPLHDNHALQGDGMGETYPPFVAIEAVYMCWFTLEFFIRLLSSPSKVERRRMELTQVSTDGFHQEVHEYCWSSGFSAVLY